jgi:hypothetical protein
MPYTQGKDTLYIALCFKYHLQVQKKLYRNPVSIVVEFNNLITNE